MDLISVIVPVYNVSNYLKECVDSIINQSYKNIEILLIDDGSTDDSGKICDKYAKKDKRIKVFHKENGGLSDARNVGLDNCSGEYICFIDSDDFVTNNYVELLYAAIKENSTLLSQCGFSRYNNGLSGDNVCYDNNKVINKDDFFYDNFTKHQIDNTVVWNKLYSKKLLGKIRFEKGKIHEDEFFTYKIIDKVDRISIISDCLYMYRVNESSITRRKYNVNRLAVLDAFMEKEVYFKNKGDERIYKEFINVYAELLLEHYSLVKKFLKDKKIEKRIISDFKKMYKPSKIKYKKMKIKTALFYISPSIYYLIMRSR